MTKLRWPVGGSFQLSAFRVLEEHVAIHQDTDAGFERRPSIGLAGV
jgi:hypothetical protein